MIDGSGRSHAAAEHRELELANLRGVAHRAVDHRAREAAILHSCGHQPADAGVIRAILQHHHVNRPRFGGVDGLQHAFRCFGAILVLFLLQQHRDRGAGELDGRERPHLVRHVPLLPVQLLHGVGDGGHLDHPESLHQRIAGWLRHQPKRRGERRRSRHPQGPLHKISLSISSSDDRLESRPGKYTRTSSRSARPAP